MDFGGFCCRQDRGFGYSRVVIHFRRIIIFAFDLLLGIASGHSFRAWC